MKDSNFTLLDLKDPNTCLEGIWKHIPGHIRLTFVSAVILGLAAHLYAFTNKLPNLDDTLNLFGTTYGRGSGRWFLDRKSVV